jgi:hypothetical protein
MMRTSTWFAVAYSSLLFACAGDTDDGFTTAETVPDPEITIQTARKSSQVDVKHLAPRAQVNPQTIRKVQEKIEAIAHHEIEASQTAIANPTKLAARSTVDGALYAFPGMSIADVDTALGGETGITPPDQGLCAGNGFVLEMVNSALQVYDILGFPVGGSVDNAAFFNFPPNTATSGSFASDPKCYFDQASGRFFAIVLRIPFDPTTFAITGSFLDIAVSDSNDPRGTWHVGEVDLTDDGTNGSPNHPHCPCLGDQPLLGADANGIYVSTNEFALAEAGFNGAQIYALDKGTLVNGQMPSIVHLANLVLANGIGFSVQPSASPTGTGSADANGSEYFLSSLDFFGEGDNRIAIWSLSNTASLADATPSVTLEHAVLKSETYGEPPPANQPANSGPTPLKDCLAAGNCPDTSGLGGLMASNTIEQMETNDDRMNQTVFAGGHVYGALNTAVQVTSGTRAGIAMFVVEPKRLSSGKLGAKMTRQSYIALDDADVMFPSIAVTDDGDGAMAFSLSGPNDFPSAAYIRMKGGKFSFNVHIAGTGTAPLDNYDGYQFFEGQGQGPCRFGDYSAALIDGTTLWMAAESVNSTCSTFPCTDRDTFVNWGTTVSRIDLSDTVDN